MPVLHTQFSGQGKSPKGEVAQLPPAIALALRGPVLQAAVFIAEQIANQMVAEGKPLQGPISGYALIDTGASTTCIDEEAAQQLQLPVIDVVKMCSASHAAHPANVYPVQLRIAGLPNTLNAPRAIGAPLKVQGLIALIGRDILSHVTLIYNGGAGEVTFAI